MDIKDLEQLFSILKANDITEFELEREGMKVKLNRGARLVQQVAAASSASAEMQPAFSGVPSPAVNSGPHAAANAAPAIDYNLVKVESPIVGTFYRKPSPDSDTFFKERESVKKGETICIIEAMKLMNEIEAPCDGRVDKSMISDGKVVEYGEILFLINPSA